MYDEQLLQRFWSKVKKSDACWEWQAALTHGYGTFQVGRNGESKLVRAHRLSWELAHGPIDKDMLVCHACDNRRCVRPDHLFLGTNAANMADASRKGRMHPGTRQYNAKLTEDSIREARSMRNSGLLYKDIAAKLGVHTVTLWQALNDKRYWKHMKQDC